MNVTPDGGAKLRVSNALSITASNASPRRGNFNSVAKLCDPVE